MIFAKVNHGVQIVGYNSTGNYYIIKNSWDTTWGMDGFGYVDMDLDCMLNKRIFVVGRKTESQKDPN